MNFCFVYDGLLLSFSDGILKVLCLNSLAQMFQVHYIQWLFAMQTSEAERVWIGSTEEFFVATSADT